MENMAFCNMFYSKAKRQLASIQEVINNHSRGIYKRIDENRELMELLARDHGPYFLERNPWVGGWLGSQDNFLDALRDAAGLPANRPGVPKAGYPRPRPSYNTCSGQNNGSLPQISNDEICQRISENRALMNLLQAKAPDDFMREYPWVDGLLHWQGEFLTKVAAIFGVPLPQYQSDSHYSCPVKKADIRRDEDINPQGVMSMETSKTNEQDDLVCRAKELSYRIHFMTRSIATGGQCSVRAFSHRDIPDRERLHLIAVLADVGHNLPHMGMHPVEFEKQEVENAISVTEFIATRQQVPDGFDMLTKGFNRQQEVVSGASAGANEKTGYSLDSKEVKEKLDQSDANTQGGVDSGTNTRADERKYDADELARLKEKQKQLDAIEATCRQSNSTIGGPRFNFSIGIGATVFLALLLLLSFTRLPSWSIFPCSLVVSFSVFYLTEKFSSRPLTWTESIDRLLADYDPIDKDSYRRLQNDSDADGYIDRCRVSDWLVAERKVLRVARSGVAPVMSEFLRKIV